MKVRRAAVMAVINRVKGFDPRSDRDGLLGPRGAFLVAIAATAAGWSIASHSLPTELLIPAASTLLFALALLFAVIAWLRRNADEQRVTYWDVSGALFLIGICAAATVDPVQLAGVFEGASTGNQGDGKLIR